MGAVLTQHLPTAWHQPIIQIHPQAWSVVSLLCKQITGTIHEPVGGGGGRCFRSRCRGHPSHLLRRVRLCLPFPLESDPTHIFSGHDGCCCAHPMSGLVVCTQYVICSLGHNALGVRGWVTLLVWASTTKYHGLSIAEVYFSQLWRPGVQDQDAILWAADFSLCLHVAKRKLSSSGCFL